MFNRQKSSIDIKKSTQKVLDSKKDSTARLKHLKLILDTVDVEEAKGIFATHYSSIYHVVYESIVSLEAKIKGPVHQKQREELESILYIFEKILIFLPDLLHCRWQLHSLSRLFARLSHAQNATRLRREAIRLFVLWYGALGDAAPKEVDELFATIVKNVLPPKPPDDVVAPLEILGINQDKHSDNDATEHLLECLLDFMVTESLKHLWNEVGRSSCFQFVFDKFKMLYLLDIFPDFRITHDLYTDDVLALPGIRIQGADTSQATKIGCQVVFIKWVANYTHSVYKLSSATNSRPGQPSSKEVDENVIAKNVILGTRENINIVHEVFRRALLYNFGQSAVIRRIICVYKDWIQMNVPEPPIFMLEPDDSKEDLKIGAQKILRLFFVNSSSVFMLYGAPTEALLEEQVDICKRVLNIYRYAVMNTRMDAETWEQLLVVMLHVTSTVLDPRAKNSLGSKLSSALFQTLIVSWVKASLNVKISVALWDEFQTVLSSLSFSDNLVTEWSKTMETLTRVLSRHVYNLDLGNLPLDRLSEQKRKRAGLTTKKPPLANKELAPTSTSAQSESLSSQNPSDQSLPVQKREREHGSKRHKVKIKRSFSDSEAYNRSFVKPGAALHKSRSIDLSIYSSFTDISSIVSLETNHNNLIDASLPDQHSVEDEAIPKDLPDDALGIIEGGVVKGWLPSVAAVLWQRMLGVLGDVNKFPYHKTHAHFFQVLNDIWTSLFKIHKNLAVSVDNMSSPQPPDFVPPLQLIAPWCFGTLELPKEYNSSKMQAVSLLCDITLEDALLGQDYFAKFYACLHRINLSSLLDLKSEIVRKLGKRIIGKMLPGFTLMLFDLVHLSLSILATGELSKMPRMEASTLLANIFFVSKFTTDLPVLNPQQLKFQPVSSTQNPEICLSQILKCSKIEATSYARAIALQALTVHATSILHHIRMSELASGESPTLTEAEKHQFEVIMNHLISSVNVENRNICLVSADLILSLASYADEIHRYFSEMQREVILGLLSSITNTLVYSSGRPFEKRLLLSLIMCLGEWCMSIPVAFMYTEDSPEYELLSSVFEALLQIVQGKSAPRKYVSKLKDFNPSVPFDDLQQYDLSSSKSKDAQPRIDYHIVQLAAKNLIYHLETQLGHFPIRSSDRCGSVVCENHDTIYDTEDMTSAVFTLPNLQMFAIDSSRILTVIELDNDDLDGSYVRFILRDLSGKACWDINGLQLSALPVEPEWNLSAGNEAMDPYADDGQQYVGSLNPVVSSVPRLALRKRLSSQLPTVTNSAHDFDNLDDLLTYMAHSSPECFPTFTKQATDDKEDDVVSTLVNQRNAELQHLSTATYPVLPPGDDVYHKTHNSSFRNSRRFLSQLGFNSWEKRKSIQLLHKDEKLLRELKHLDTQRCRETHKIAVFYVAEGQEDKHSILCNSGGSEDYEEFVAGLGWEVELDSHCGFMGGLLRNKSTGETMPYYATSFSEVIFHVSTRMPSTSSDDLLQKTRHLGNDEVHIVWSEHGRDYRRDIIPTEFCDVLIVIYPKEFGLYRVTINRKSNVPYFGPLYDECVVEKSVLPHLVRCTAINASRAVRSSLQFFQHYFEQRQKSLETIMNNHQVRSTFESFTASLYRPMHPTPVFHPGSSNRASATSYTSTNTTRTISSPLLPPTISADSHFSSANHQFESSTSQESGSIPPSPTPPVPPKRLSVKLGSGFKPKLTTPPISPNLLRK